MNPRNNFIFNTIAMICLILYIMLAMLCVQSDAEKGSAQMRLPSAFGASSEEGLLEHYENLRRQTARKKLREENAKEETVREEVFEPSPEEEADTPPSYSEDDVYCLAVVICNEAGCASEEVMMMVGNVVLNRVKSSFYPDTIREVLTQKYQYGMMWKRGVRFSRYASQEQIDKSRELAIRLLEGETVFPDNVLYQAEFEQGSGIFMQTEGFYFCYY